MFLDEELLELCKNAECDTPEQIQKLNEDVCAKCEQYYKNRMSLSLTKKEIKILLDRTFNLFDSFVRMAVKSNDKKVQILGGMFQKFTFKQQLLANEKMAEVYNRL